MLPHSADVAVEGPFADPEQGSGSLAMATGALQRLPYSLVVQGATPPWAWWGLPARG